MKCSATKFYGHFEKTKPRGSYVHNFRHYKKENEPSYLLPLEFRLPNYYWRRDGGANALYKQKRAEYDEAHKGNSGKRPKQENSDWECVLLLQEQHTEADLWAVIEKIESEWGIECYSAVIHNDEGHIDENGEPIYNRHAHINFITLNAEAQQWRKVGPKHLIKMGDELAKILKMPRGEFKKDTGRVNIKPNEFRQIQKDRAKLEAELAAQKAEQEKELEKSWQELAAAQEQNKQERAKLAEWKTELEIRDEEIGKVVEEMGAAVAEVSNDEERDRLVDNTLNTFQRNLGVNQCQILWERFISGFNSVIERLSATFTHKNY